jgi:hypothetical protein
VLRRPLLLLLLGCDRGATRVAQAPTPEPAPPPAAAPTPEPATPRPVKPDPCRSDLPPDTWTPVGPGVEYSWRRFEPPPQVGCNRLDILRVDPAQAPLRALMRSESGGKPRTAMSWCTSSGALATINLGMFEPDFATHTGYLRSGQHLNSAAWRDDYRSTLVWEVGRAQLVDDVPSPDAFPTASVLTQNLRLIAAPGKNVWKENGRRWSEAALAQDTQGRLLLLHTRAAFSMAELNQRLLALPLQITRAMHLEGGPEASLAVCASGFELERVGSFETGFFDDDNLEAWPLPNVLAIGAR